MSGKLDTATDLEREIYRRLDGGNFGHTSLDCIRAVLHASGLVEQVAALRDTLGPMAYGYEAMSATQCHTAARSVLESYPRPDLPALARIHSPEERS
jgi:hypothetical protein